jgi:CRISPR/Cas system-associated endonuclease Cas3-HD
MNRDYILNQIRETCIAEYAKMDNWIHNIHHVSRVVKNGKRIAKLENVRSKDEFLVEVACWLHDLGRVGEKMGLIFQHSNHAEESYLKSKQILKPFASAMGRESVYKVLEAVREHSMPTLKHPENLISKMLQDADRGSGLCTVGFIGLLANIGLVETEVVKTNSEAIKRIGEIYEQLRKSKRTDKACEALEILRDWYYGCDKQKGTGCKVSPLHTETAKKIFKPGLKEVENFIEKLQNGK